MYGFRITVALVPALALNFFLPFRFVKGRYLATLAFLIGFLLTSGSSGTPFQLPRFLAYNTVKQTSYSTKYCDVLYQVCSVPNYL